MFKTDDQKVWGSLTELTKKLVFKILLNLLRRNFEVVLSRSGPELKDLDPAHFWS